jgi:membrane fusion protein (multidrug efflux system)
MQFCFQIQLYNNFNTKEMETKRKKSVKIIVMVAAAVIVVSISLFFLLRQGTYESTDNAQIDGNIVPIRSSVTAYIHHIHFKDNESVKEGQLLITFDTVELKAKVDEAQAALENASTNLEIAENKARAGEENSKAYDQNSASGQQNVLSAKANLEKVQSNFDRISKLLNIKGATQEQFENAQAALEIARSDYAKSINQYQSSLASANSYRSQAKADKSQIELAKAVIKQREAELTLAKEQLAHAYIKAPCHGVVTKRAVQEGQYVSSGQSLCVVIDDTRFWISANFKETQLSGIRPGQKAEIKIDALGHLKLKGIVESTSGATGAKFALLPPDNSTGNFIKIVQRVPVRISLNTLPESDIHLLYPGLSAFVKVKIK